MTKRALGAAALAVVAAVGAATLRSRHEPRRVASMSDRNTRAPNGVRIRVQVLNASRVHGLARRATLFLRDQGFDVVEVGTTTPLDSTLVLDRSNHREWADLVARALGGGSRVVARPDSSRYLDVTVLLGGSWRAPAEPFYP